MIHQKVGSWRTFHGPQCCGRPYPTFSILYIICGCTTSIWCHCYIFIGYFMVTGGQFSHLVIQIKTLLSLLVCGRPTSTDTRLVSFTFSIFILKLFPIEIRALSVFLVHIYFHLLGASAHNFRIQDVSTSYCRWFFHPLILYHPLCYCHLNEKLVYHRLSCPLCCQYEPGIQMGEWGII